MKTFKSVSIAFRLGKWLVGVKAKTHCSRRGWVSIAFRLGKWLVVTLKSGREVIMDIGLNCLSAWEVVGRR